MNRNNFFKKTLVFTIITLFISVSITPCINAFLYNGRNEEKYGEKINDIILNSLNNANNDDTAFLTFYTFDKTGRKENKVELPGDIAFVINDLFEDLEYKIVYDPRSVETQELKNSFISLVDEYGLLSEKQSKDEVFSLLNPVWLKSDDNNNLRVRNPFSSAFTRPFLGAYFGSSVFCSVSSAGSGLVMPLFMLPRPRAVGFWFSYDYSVTSVANLFTGRGFVAGGVQGGLLFGFMGIGLTYAVPGVTLYGFIGYSLFAGVTAEYMEFYPPNREPVISEGSPENGAFDVPVSLSMLSFRIDDADGDLMSYSVTTDPDIGSGQGQLKKNGVYSVPVSGLVWDKKYSWTVGVSDGNVLVEKKFSFITVGSPPFDPFDEGWSYRKKITINHTQVFGNLVDFPVLVSVVDVDLRDKAQFDGDDVLFMDGSGVANKIYHEIENYDSSSGELVVWVKVPSLSSSQDTEFYMYYGNPSCSNQEFSEKVWDSNYCAVWHLNNFYDSTFNSNDGTNHGTDDCLGKISFAKDFVGTNNDYIDVGDMPTPSDNIIRTATFEAWINPRELANTAIINKMDNGREPDRRGYNFHLENYKTEFGVWPGTWYHDESRISAKTNDNIISYNNWQYIAATVDLSRKNIDLYYNGEETPSSISILGTPPTYFYDIELNEWLGAYRGEGFSSYYDGFIDEIRISKICRSSSWISTEYNNQNDPFNFLSFGPEESPP